ncbi:hypothetical protein ACFLRF_04660, partial [Candidatus Altiarchaeota archaeon]
MRTIITLYCIILLFSGCISEPPPAEEEVVVNDYRCSDGSMVERLSACPTATVMPRATTTTIYRETTTTTLVTLYTPTTTSTTLETTSTTTLTPPPAPAPGVRNMSMTLINASYNFLSTGSISGRKWWYDRIDFNLTNHGDNDMMNLSVEVEILNDGADRKKKPSKQGVTYVGDILAGPIGSRGVWKDGKKILLTKKNVFSNLRDGVKAGETVDGIVYVRDYVGHEEDVSAHNLNVKIIDISDKHLLAEDTLTVHLYNDSQDITLHNETATPYYGYQI